MAALIGSAIGLMNALTPFLPGVGTSFKEDTLMQRKSRKLLSLPLALVIALSIFTVPALAAATLSTDKTNYASGDAMTNSYSGVTLDPSIGRIWIAVAEQSAAIGDYVSGYFYHLTESSGTVTKFAAPDKQGKYEVRLYQGESKWDAGFAQLAATGFTVSEAQPAHDWTSSGWAQPEIEKAESYGIIPDSLMKEDLTKPITRSEFAAVAVKTYENLTGKKAAPVSPNPFTDTSDPEVLKA
jgi:hypothetical protein